MTQYFMLSNCWVGCSYAHVFCDFVGDSFLPFFSWRIWALTRLCRGLVKKTSLTLQVDQSTTTKCIRSTTPRAPGRKDGQNIVYGLMRITFNESDAITWLIVCFSCTFMCSNSHPSKDRGRCRVWHEDQFRFTYGTFSKQLSSSAGRVHTPRKV